MLLIWIFVPGVWILYFFPWWWLSGRIQEQVPKDLLANILFHPSHPQSTDLSIWHSKHLCLVSQWSGWGALGHSCFQKQDLQSGEMGVGWLGYYKGIRADSWAPLDRKWGTVGTRDVRGISSSFQPSTLLSHFSRQTSVLGLPAASQFHCDFGRPPCSLPSRFLWPWSSDSLVSVVPARISREGIRLVHLRSDIHARAKGMSWGRWDCLDQSHSGPPLGGGGQGLVFLVSHLVTFLLLWGIRY